MVVLNTSITRPRSLIFPPSRWPPALGSIAHGRVCPHIVSSPRWIPFSSQHSRSGPSHSLRSSWRCSHIPGCRLHLLLAANPRSKLHSVTPLSLRNCPVLHSRSALATVPPLVHYRF